MELFRDQSTQLPSGVPAVVTNFYPEYDYHNKEEEAFYQNLKIIYIVFSILLTIAGVALLIFILAKKELRSHPTFWLVINVLVVIIIEGLVLLPMFSTFRDFRGGIVGCHVMYVFTNFDMLHTQIALMLLIIDRFIYFFKPEKHAYHMSPRTVRVLICCFVFLELVLSISTTFTLIKPILDDHSGSLMCISTTHWEYAQINNFFLHIVPMLLNVIFGLIVLVSVLIRCCKPTKNSDNYNGKQAIALILLLVFFDVACTVPFMMSYVIHYTSDYGIHIFIQVLYFLFYIIVCILLVLLIPDFRTAVTSYCKPGKKGESVPLMPPN